MQKILSILLAIFVIVNIVQCTTYQQQTHGHQNLEEWQEKLQEITEGLIEEAQIENERLKSQNREYLNGGLLKILNVLKNLDRKLSEITIPDDPQHQQYENTRRQLQKLANQLGIAKQTLEIEIQKLENFQIRL
ncbi:hypothetical protein DERF_014376 [Dermatophagoides farinae]|uniref:Uncharacterized protein n=1 Tax=Dermatophagoides farinae TaxID=6954 RepID=A0A922HNX7_DERFA|nr:hypothetical protein DERF_014376 [Dermatophagoides farinae]